MIVYSKQHHLETEKLQFFLKHLLENNRLPAVKVGNIVPEILFYDIQIQLAFLQIHWTQHVN